MASPDRSGRRVGEAGENPARDHPKESKCPEYKAAGILGEHTNAEGQVYNLVSLKRGKVELLGGKIEAIDGGDPWNTALRECDEESNRVFASQSHLRLGPHMIVGMYSIPNAKYRVFVVSLTDAHRAIPTEAYGTKELHDDLERQVVWIPREELRHLVYVQNKGRFPGLFDGWFRRTTPPMLPPSRAISETVPVHELMLPRMFDGVGFAQMCQELVERWNVTVDHRWPHAPLFCVTYKSGMQIWKGTREQVDFLTQNRGTIYEARMCPVTGRMSYRTVAMGLEKFWRHDSPQLTELERTTAIAAAWRERSTVQIKYDGFNFKVYWYRQQWMVSTNSSVDASSVTLRGSSLNALRGFDDAVRCSRVDWAQLDRAHTYVFELVHPHARLVVPYAEPRLVHLMTRDNRTLCEVDPTHAPACLMRLAPETMCDVQSHSECVARCAGLKFWHGEGFVVMQPGSRSRRRIKYKSDSYAQEHRLLLETHVTTSIKRAEYVVGKWQSDELGIVLEWHPQLRPLVGNLLERVQWIAHTFLRLVSHVDTGEPAAYHASVQRLADKWTRPILKTLYQNPPHQLSEQEVYACLKRDTPGNVRYWLIQMLMWWQYTTPTADVR